MTFDVGIAALLDAPDEVWDNPASKPQFDVRLRQQREAAGFA